MHLKNYGTFIFVIPFLARLHILFSYFGLFLQKSYFCILPLSKSIFNNNKQRKKLSVEFHTKISCTQMCKWKWTGASTKAYRISFPLILRTIKDKTSGQCYFKSNMEMVKTVKSKLNCLLKSILHGRSSSIFNDINST